MTRSFLPALAALAFFTSVACARPDVIVLPPDGGGSITIDGRRVAVPSGATHAVKVPEFFNARAGAPIPEGYARIPAGSTSLLGVAVPAGATHYKTAVDFRSGPVKRNGFVGTIDALTAGRTQKGPTGESAPTTGAEGTCDPNKPCAPGFTCENGVCVPTAPTTSAEGTCDANKPCAPGFTCENGVCVPTAPTTSAEGTCDANKPCAPGFKCEGGVCVPDGPIGDLRDLEPTRPVAPTPPPAPPAPPVAPRNDDPLAHSFDEAVRRARAENKVLLVDFFATWCGPCKRLASESLPSLLGDAWVRQNAIVVKVDIDREPGLKQRFRVGGIPDLRVLRVGRDGLEAAGAATGFRSASQLRSMLQSAR